MDIDNFICITSVIYTTNTPLSYSNTRSIYSPQERTQQTLETINSIREKIPNCYILMVEGSQLNNNEIQLFKKVVNDIIILNVPEINNKYKNLGEIKQLLEAIIYSQKYKFKYFWKISGRYKLNSGFNYSLFDNDLNQSKHVEDVMSTILIKI